MEKAKSQKFYFVYFAAGPLNRMFDPWIQMALASISAMAVFVIWYLITLRTNPLTSIPSRWGNFHFGAFQHLSHNGTDSGLIDFCKSSRDCYRFIMTDTLSRGKENRACYRQLRTLLYINSEQTSMELALKELNNYIREHYKSLFVDLLYFELDSRNRLIRFINAGFEPIACYSASRQVLQVFSDTDSVPLGITENVSYRQKEVQLFEDDTLVFFNSGVTRARNNAGVLFGIEGIKRVLHAVYKANPGEIAHHTVYEALTFNRARSRSDMIVLAVKVS